MMRPPVIWLGTNTCAGDMLSMLNSLNPGYQSLIYDLIDFRFDYLLGSAEGDTAIGILKDAVIKLEGKYILVVEGTVTARSGGLYSVIGHISGQPLTSLQAVQELGAAAKYVVAAGTCAAFGGPYAARPNPTDSVPIQKALDRKVINVPGCPINPDWMMGTLVHLIRYGEPELDDYNRPKMFFGRTIHDLCQRRDYFDNGVFAKNPGEPWCMYNLGCKGPVTYADCPDRQWSGEHLSWPVKASTPCIGCTSPEFPDGDSPFFEHLPDISLPGIKLTANRIGWLTGALTALGMGTHLLGNIVTGRLIRTYKKDLSGGPGKKIRSLNKKIKSRL